MPRKNATYIVFDKSLKEIKDALVRLYGLKRIVSAGVYLFNKLSANEREQVLAELHALAKAADVVNQSRDDAARQKQKKSRKTSKVG